MGLGKGKKKLGKLGTMEKRELPVETDPHKLVTQVCGANILTSGEEVQVYPYLCAENFILYFNCI